ncbi:c-type cytochrome [Pollutibacter soli]|uniref:c-type cytochrome n=1 Tax=Pollutibacter soli TaxID=3034157 RepID=UPI0030137159
MKLHLRLTTVCLVGAILFLGSCNNEGKSGEEKSSEAQDKPADQAEVHGTEMKAGDIELTTPLNQQWVTAGKGIYELKCQSCHKLTDERLVGPGWKDVTKRRQPEWIMNMITNVDMMLEKDPEAQKLLEQCLVRMPNQNISKDESRHILEFMRSNDGIQ